MFYRLVIYADEDGRLSPRSPRIKRLKMKPSTLKRYLRELARLDLVEKRDGEYYLTEKGFKLRRSLLNLLEKPGVAPDKGYVITDPLTSAPLPLRVTSLEQLYAVIAFRLAPDDVVVHHVRAGYLAQWIRTVLGDEALADEIDELRIIDDPDRVLERLLDIVETRLRVLESIRSIEEKRRREELY